MVETIETGTYVEPTTPDTETTNQDGSSSNDDNSWIEDNWLVIVLPIIGVIVAVIIFLLVRR